MTVYGYFGTMAETALKCGGYGKSVSQFSHAGWAGHNCGHEKDADVI